MAAHRCFFLPMCAVAALATACTTSAPDAAATPSSTSVAGAGSMLSTSNADVSSSEVTEPTASSTAATIAASDSAAVDASAGVRQRCLDAVSALDRRIDEENFEFPDEGPELSEEELERTLLPAVEYVDGVAGPGQRPALDPMPEFDEETIPILDLDLLVGNCFEFGILVDDDD